MLSCLLWCFGREINNRHFEDCKRTLEELKSFFFFFFLNYYYSLYTWTTDFVDPLAISFNDFLVFFFFFLLVRSFFCSCVVGLCFAFLMIFLLRIKKNY